ncbi:MAG: hypothetical protein FD187_2208 [bacterium]|nr:MAG: hypothetical protein FD142_2583 [bacterium]KAF0148097.1 MAG: hypothetical protein FD187_2208 [bacterium]KAF0167637.1 MAG: hypothetical protein FD158_2113 [bacterium]TXT19453.1 MAG: hypothetical protein FD132_1722 [bacterium]
MNRTPRDLAQATLGVLFIGALLIASFFILQPFLPALIWAVMIVVPTWKIMLAIQARLWGKRALAVAAMSAILLLILVVPLSMGIVAIVENSHRILGWGQWLASFRLPPVPDWIAGLPLVGERIAHFWQQVAAAGIEDFAARLAPYASDVTAWFVAELGRFGMLVLQFFLIVILAAILYAGGEEAAAWMRQFGKRLAGEQGENAVVLAGRAIRGVALGVVITAVVQSVLGGIGLALAGVPLAGVLTVVMFMFCIAQLGPALILVPAVVWVFWTGETGWGVFLLVWTLIVGTLDNFLRPYLIKQGADLPLLLIFAGVIGGLLSMGLIGIFVGPVLLAVTYTLLDAWVKREVEPPGASV